MKGKTLTVISVDTEKAIDKKLTPLHNKNIQKTRKRELTQHHKGYLWKTQS